MANKFIDVSAANNGDGTTSAQAASAGAAGAWNSLVNCLNGSPGYGSIANGDDIYIRTKNGTNLSESYSAGNITTAARTSAACVRWIFDDGSVWAGDSGVFTLTLGLSATGRSWTFNSFNSVLGVDNNFILNIPFTGTSLTVLSAGACLIRGMTIVGVEDVGNKGLQIRQTAPSGNNNAPCTTYERCLFDIGRINSSLTMFEGSIYGSKLLFVDCDFDITGADSGLAQDAILFGFGSYGSEIELIGGRVIGSTVYQRLAKLTTNSTSGLLRASHFDSGSLLLDPPSSTPFTEESQTVAIDLSDCGAPHHMTYNTTSCRIDWRSGQNYPVGNAVLPDAANTPWSYKVFSRASKGRPAQLFTLNEVYTAAAATKTITVNLLINDALTSPKKDEWWMDVSYVRDSDGLRVSQTTWAFGAMTAASSVWDATVYGAENYSEYKLALTTASAIKQHTEIVVTVFCARPSGAATNFYFVDPEMVIS